MKWNANRVQRGCKENAKRMKNGMQIKCKEDVKTMYTVYRYYVKEFRENVKRM